jgi:tetratricopeptide (TPR) repeat protein
MTKTSAIELLGEVLQQAGLVTNEQIETALREQSQSNHRKIGELLALRGWIEPKTADFFAEQWSQLLKQKQKELLGQYLKQAGLLDEEQIRDIVKEQEQTSLRFGEIAVLKGWLNQSTIDFFLKNLGWISQGNLQENDSIDKSEHIQKIIARLLDNHHCEPFCLLNLYQQILVQGEVATDGSDEQAELLKLRLVVKSQNKLRVANPIYSSVLNQSWVDRELARLDPYGKIRFKLLKLDEIASLPYRLLTEILSWTGHQPFLLQKLGQLLHESESFILAGEEAAQVEQLVQTSIIEHWETQAAGKHLKEIQDRLLNNQQCQPVHLLRLYQAILQEGGVPADGSREQAELVKLGLVAEEQGRLRVANRIYQAVFNRGWVEEKLAEMIRVFQEQPILATEPIVAENSPQQRGNKTARRIAILLILAGATFAGLWFLSLWFVAKSRGIEIFQAGNQLLNQGSYQEAIAQYDRVLNINANYYQAWTNRGYALAGLREYDRMLDSCTSATIIEPRAVYAWNCQGEALYNLQQYGEAIAAFDKAIALDSQDPLFWINKTESLLALKQTEPAIEAINQAIELLEPDGKGEGQEPIRELSVAFSHQGRALSQQQEYEKALAAYDRSLKYAPDYFTAQRGRGIVLRNLKRFDEAIAQFNQILNHSKLTDAQKAETWYYLGLTLRDSFRSREAIAAFDEALKLKPDYRAAEEAKQRL